MVIQAGKWLRPLVIVGCSVAVVAAVYLVDRKWQASRESRVEVLGALAAPAAAPAGGVLPASLIRLEPQAQYTVERTYAGVVAGRRTSDLGFQRPGVLYQVMAVEGARVNEGDVLARLDTAPLEAQRMSAVAQIERVTAERSETQARLGLARSTASRNKVLAQGGSVSKTRLDETDIDQRALEARLAATDAAIREAQAGLGAVDAALAQSEIRAPYSGSIVRRLADEGTSLAAGVPVFRLVEDGILDVRVGLPAEAAADLTIGRVMTVHVGERRLDGVLTTLVPGLDERSRTVPAVFRLPEGTTGIPVGQVARVTVRRSVPEAGYWLPVTALVEGRRGLWSAYVAEPDGDGGLLRLGRRDVVLIHSDGGRAFVRGSLQPDDQVVGEGIHRLVPGQLVRAR